MLHYWDRVDNCLSCGIKRTHTHTCTHTHIHIKHTHTHKCTHTHITHPHTHMHNTHITPTHIHMHNTHMHTAESVLPTVLGSTLSIAAIILIALLVLLVIVIVICVKSWLFKRKLVRLSESHFSFSSSSIGLVGCLEYPVATLLEQMQTEDPGSLNAPLSEQMGLSNQSVRLLYIPKCVC